VNVGVGPMLFSEMVFEARKLVQKSEAKAQGLEQLAQEVYKQAGLCSHSRVGQRG
jgi:hypothetical protein